MNIKKAVLLLASHAAVAFIGFAAGLYTLPILTAPPAPTELALTQAKQSSLYSGEFKRELADSDGLHWGEGTVSIGSNQISLLGELAPGPDYKLYLSPQFVETEADFERLKSTMVQVGNINTFDNFIVPLSTDIDPAQFNTVIVWCESFGQFITAAQYRQ